MAETSGSATRERWLLSGSTLFLSLIPIALLLAPVPLAVLIFRHGLRAGIIAAVLSGLIASILTLNPLILAQVLLVLALGVALGEAMREGLSLKQTLVVGSFVTFVTTLLLMFLIDRVLGMSPIDMVAEFWKEALAGVAGSGQIPEDFIELQLAQMRLTMPASLVMGSVGLTVIDFSLSRWLLGKLPAIEGAPQAPAMVPFAHWRFPKGVAGLYVIVRIVEMTIFSSLGSLLQVVLVNGLLVLGMLMTAQGAAVAWYFVVRRVSKGLAVALFAGLLLFLNQLLVLALILIAVLDAWFDFRKLERKAPPRA